MVTGLVTSPNARIADHATGTFLLAPDGSARQLTGDSAELIRAILDFCVAPRTREQLLQHLEALSGGAIADPRPVDDAVALLTSSGALLSAGERAAPPARGRLLLCVSGAVAAANAPDLALRLFAAGFELRIAMTRDARRFVSPLVLEAVSGQPVATSLWRREVPHIALAEWAELVLICPASATTISRIAAGDCSDLVSAIAVGARGARLVVPSMNAALYHSPAVQRNLSLLRDDGFWLAGTAPGLVLAHPPAARAPIGGAMPSPAAVVDLACFIASRR
jgi:Flavoprotein